MNYPAEGWERFGFWCKHGGHASGRCLADHCAYCEESSGYPFSDPGGRVDFTQILSQLVSRRQEFAGARTVYLIVDSRLPNQVDYWPAFQPWWTSREQIFGLTSRFTVKLWAPKKQGILGSCKSAIDTGEKKWSEWQGSELFPVCFWTCFGLDFWTVFSWRCLQLQVQFKMFPNCRCLFFLFQFALFLILLGWRKL